MGRWGMCLLDAFRRSARCELIATFDTNKVIAQRLCTATQTFHQLVEDPHIDAIAIATPATTHAELASAALRAGKHVFLEKPMALSLQDALSLQALAAERARCLMIGHIMHYHAGVLALKAHATSGALGKPLLLNAVRSGGQAMASPFDALWTLAPHDISVGISLFGRDWNAVHAVQTPDSVSVQLDFANGAAICVELRLESAPRCRRLTLVTERGLVCLDESTSRSTLTLCENGSSRHIPFAMNEPLLAEIKCFVGAVLDGTPTPTDAAEGVAVVRALSSASTCLARATGAHQPQADGV
ncbi:MAG: Gfo/Idh/MocA family oxidoreductase [Myxococcales bacterium]|nr:Gfo/Idh/MocA family oxidoreductase [Myxococcales bacterium]